MMSESQLRYRLKKLGYVARKSRARRGSLNNLGGFMIVHLHSNTVAAGERYDLELADLAAFIAED